MKILVQMSHPAHFHLYKKTIQRLIQKKHQVFIVIKSKDILESLLKNEGLPYYNILRETPRRNNIDVIKDLIIREFRLVFFCIKHKIDLMTGCTPELTHVSWLLRKPGIITGEDDAAIVPAYGKIAAPFLKIILSPMVCDNGKYEDKSIKYDSYHELAYLHPNHFTPQKKIVANYFDPESPYFIIRFAKLNAHHDVGIKGINTTIAQKIIDLLKPHGTIYITSERELEPQFEPYRIKINPLDMHHVMAFAQLYIGDSQTMAAEAGVLGVPFIRFNDFVGKIGYLRELEEKYQLGYGVKTDQEEMLYLHIKELLEMSNRKETFAQRRTKMLSEKIDYAMFLEWFIENFPESASIMRLNPDYQYKFK